MFFRTLLAYLLAFASGLTAAQERNATPPPKLKYEMVQEEVLEDGSPVKYYKFFPAGSFKPGIGVLICRHMNGVFDDNIIYVDADGALKSFDGKDDVMFPLAGKKMECFEILLAVGTNEKDIQVLGTCTVVPFPAVATNEAGHRIEVEATNRDGKHFIINASGYAPGEKIQFSSRSGDEVLNHEIKADAAGQLSMGYDPSVLGMKGGTFTITFTTSDKKSLKLSHQWGDKAFK
jgi:hypothetical protein